MDEFFNQFHLMLFAFVCHVGSGFATTYSYHHQYLLGRLIAQDDSIKKSYFIDFTLYNFFTFT